MHGLLQPVIEADVVPDCIADFITGMLSCDMEHVCAQLL